VRIITSNKTLEGAIGAIGCEGKLWRYKPELVTVLPEQLRQIALPSGTYGVNRRPSWTKYNFGRNSRLFGVGSWTSNLLLDQHMRAVRQGIPAPNVVPVLAAGAGTGLTNTSILYLRYKDSLGNRVGPLSAGSDPVALVNQNRVSSNIPTTCPDPSVDTIQGLMQVDGATPRVAWERQLGTGNVTENVQTLALLDAAPDDFTAMPLGTMNTLFHDVQVVAGNNLYPERAFFSATAELERHEGLYAQTDGEFITGLWCHGDFVFLNSHEKVYRVRGFTATDINRDVEKSDLGVINHDGIASFHKKVILPTTIGFQLYDGMWHHLMRDRQQEFAREYAAYRDLYEAAQGYYNPRRNAYIFGPVTHSRVDGGGLVDWVIDGNSLIPEVQSSEFAVRIRNDRRIFQETTRAIFYLPQSGQAVQVSGDTNGMLRYEVRGGEEPTLEGVAQVLPMVARPATFAPKQGGGQTDGYRFNRLWFHIERAPAEGYTYAVASGVPKIGDQGVVPTDRLELSKEIESDVPPLGYEILQSDTPITLEGASGEAISVEFRGMNHIFKGYGLTYGPGVKKKSRVPESGGG
jgi:hypothetical protein